MITWSFVAFAFFLVPLYIGNANLDFFLISIILGIAEIISAFLSMFITRKGDASVALIVFCALSCIASIGALLFETFLENSAENQVPIAIIYMVLYVGIGTAFNLAYLVVCDLFPTIFLATSYGACNVSARLIAILSPFMAYAPKPIPILTLISYSALCIFLPMCLVKADQNYSS